MLSHLSYAAARAMASSGTTVWRSNAAEVELPGDDRFAICKRIKKPFAQASGS